MKKFFEKITNKWLLKSTTTIILVAIVIACYIAVNWGVKQIKIDDFDFTTKKLYSLSDATKDKLKELNTEVTIQLINMSEQEYVLDYADKYKNVSDKIIIERIDDISTRVDLQEKYGIDSTTPVIIVKNGEKEKLLTTSDLVTYDYTANKQVDATEEAITNGIIEVTLEEKPHIYVLETNTYYDAEQSLGFIAVELINESNEVDMIDILTTGNVPEDCDCLIITTLKQDFTELERDKILEYINNGGKLLFLSSQNLLTVETPNLNQILAQYGVSIENGIILEQDSKRMLSNTPNIIIADTSASYMSNIDMSLKILMQNAGSIKFEEAGKLEELGVTYETIATTSGKAFLRTDFNQDTNSKTDKDSEEGSFILGASVEKKISDEKTSKLIIFSNEAFASTQIVMLGNSMDYFANVRNNKDVVLNSVSHLIERDETITIRKAVETETYIVTEQEDVIIKTIIFSLPVLVIIVGIAVWIYRKRKV